ncbi:MAG: hypothetical protein COT71_01050 [Candidatus Andersenbacteria bacterium CG10_big_fil_rev_8_21_14_0_10_54_11]|uniref:Transcription-repair-coupling factor n=1 Tax=Candidatus Andersenbacteria bacterium CG10_big_fil_rev_8_21_14_0_10_54_11 TaxID=1974485 RepID=A0A2M6WZX1_9BACT|nr:MAG: hypothetical protein COT71_01050 [Candidatus Andersenbacteria bacterium CG10_big_fil_rev_8_21_14_0_10_54_11]
MKDYLSTKQPLAKCQEIIDEVLTSTMPFFSWLQIQQQAGSPPIHLSLDKIQLPLFLALWGNQAERVFTLYAGNNRQTERLHHTIRTWQSTIDVKDNWHFVSDELSEQEVSGLVVSSLSQTYHRLLAPHAAGAFLLPVSLADKHLPDPAAYAAACIQLHAGERRPLPDVIRRITAAGYVRTAATPEPGTFRVRGEMIDIRPPAAPAITITWHRQDIETITSGNGSSRRQHRRRTLPPAAFPAQTVSWNKLLASYSAVVPADRRRTPAQQLIIYNALTPAAAFPLRSANNPADVCQTSDPIVLANNVDRTRRFCTQLGIAAPHIITHPLARFPIALAGTGRAFVTETALLPPLDDSPPLTPADGAALVAELTAGKPAVHADHGIGIFEGLAARTIEGHTREYLILRYAAGDTLSVPVEYAYKVTAYLGDHAPMLHRLGGTIWRKAKAHATHDAQRFAHELLTTAARRQHNQRPSYRIDPEVETTLVDNFPYTLTPDQAAAWQDICTDLSAPRPADRLIVGDVGFGKTELAIRAARHVLANGRQTAIVAPTTLLVQQHSDTFRSRLPEEASRIALLSRFTSASEQAAVRRGLADGSIGIVIGTHAVLSPTITWHKLGLVVIDEEQRFGVRHKEALKKLRDNVDVISLSATPIPRTLSQALTGLKSLSVIATPPPGRQEIDTKLTRDNDAVIAQALAREMARGGQVYVVAPRVQGLSATARRIEQLHPDVRAVIAHGQLPDEQLAAAMEKFDTGQANVLVSSSIIEHGLDIPRANTLICLQATHFGLADLYQLRGRIGRRQQQAYAYFLYSQQQLTDMQRQRLAALTEASRLGSGWSLAQRDLEIRGAGNLLGREQAGSVSTIGVQLYLDLVRQAAIPLAAGSIDRNEININLPLPAAIPPQFIADTAVRTDYYQRLARARTTVEIEHLLNRLTRTYGPLPPETVNLAALLLLQHAAAHAGVTAITSRHITPPRDNPYDKITVTACNIPQLLGNISVLGQWSVAGNEASLHVPAVTKDTVKVLTSSLFTIAIKA